MALQADTTLIIKKKNKEEELCVCVWGGGGGRGWGILISLRDQAKKRKGRYLGERVHMRFLFFFFSLFSSFIILFKKIRRKHQSN